MGFEIEKLRSRLKNLKKLDVEYRMTAAEAKRLLEEIDNEQKPVAVVKPVAEKEATRTNIIDGGTF